MKKACFLFFVLLFYLPIDEVEFLRNRLPISEYKLSNTFCISTTLIKSPEAPLTETCHNYQKYRLFFPLKIGTVWEVYNCHDKFSKKFQFTDGNMILKFLLVSKQKYQNSLCCLQLYLLFELDWACLRHYNSLIVINVRSITKKTSRQWNSKLANRVLITLTA